MILGFNNPVKDAPGNPTKVHLHLSMPLKSGSGSFLTMLAHGLCGVVLSVSSSSAHQPQPCLIPQPITLSQTLHHLHSGGHRQLPRSPAARDFGQQVTQVTHSGDYQPSFKIKQPQPVLNCTKRLSAAGALYRASYIRAP